MKSEAAQKRSCCAVDGRSRKICMELPPPTVESQARAKRRAEAQRKAEEAEARKAGKTFGDVTAAVAAAPAVDLVEDGGDGTSVVAEARLLRVLAD
ncbi:hypothetical protein ACFUTY_32420 [Streptomyces sp. NPDC057362]|uniref:hypothetical protein n=1 Tax=Streptomyces sp. NPDC057362 TaxID=3346106 RepID=UPI00363104B7